MSSTSHHIEIRNPGPWKVSTGLRTLFLVLVVAGLAVAAIGLKSADPARVWANILTNFYYYLCLSLGGAFFIALLHVTNSFWGSPFRRIAEGLITFLPVAFVIAIIIHIFGGHHLYHWLDPEAVSHDAILTAKAAYLNGKFAFVRLVIGFSIWVIFGMKFVRNSLAQDLSGDVALTRKTVVWSAAFIPLFGLSFSFLAYDLIMALEPHWFSTIFGVYCFAGLFLSTVSVIALLASMASDRGLLPGVNENHFHDLGKFMFAFSVFWAYIMFSQLMLIWYANLPEETTYYIKRFQPGWWQLCLTLLITKFIFPFFALLPRGVKRRKSYLFKMAVFMLAAHWLDCYLMVMPNFSSTGPQFGLTEIGIGLGFFGLFAFVVSGFLSRFPVLAHRDPQLPDAMSFHQ